MNSKSFQYGILSKNILAKSQQTSAPMRTVLLGTIVKLDRLSVKVCAVQFLEDDCETWESQKFMCETDSIVPVSNVIWSFLASVNSPMERLKIAKHKIKSKELMEIYKDSEVGYLNSGEMVLATVKFVGKIQGLGKGFGLHLHEKNVHSVCDGMHGGLRYFTCRPGFGAFTTIEHVVPYTSVATLSKSSPSTEGDGVSDKHMEIMSISNGNHCEPHTLSIKNSLKQKNSLDLPVIYDKQTSVSGSKKAANVKTSISLINMLQHTSNDNNDFDHNTIIQPDNIHLMHNNDPKGMTSDKKREIDLVDVIGEWFPNPDNQDIEQMKTSKNPTEKSGKSVFYTYCPEPYSSSNGVPSLSRNRSVVPINHIVNSKTIPRRSRNGSTSNQSNGVMKEDDIQLDRKHADTHIQINRSSCGDKAAKPPSINYQTPLPGTTNDFSVGSVVEIINAVSEQPLHGVIRWFGVDPSTEQVLAGVELEEEHSHLPLSLTDGTLQGQRFFKCSKNKAIFVPIYECHKDSRFGDTTSLVVQNSPEPAYVKEMDCPIVAGLVPPLCMQTQEDVEAVCGKLRGIQGHHNSCYLDATLFAMFTFTSVFDSILYRPKGQRDIIYYEEVQQVLREHIINPLRSKLFVRSDRIMNLRKLLDQLSSVSGLTTEEKDPEEFLHSLVAQILKAEPFLKLSSGQEAYHYQLFLEKEDHLILPTVQYLFEQSFLASNIKLKEVPSCLIIQMPRFGKNYKMYPRILPSQLLDVTDVIENSPRQCTVCGNLARWECTQCFGQCGEGLESTAFCTACLEKAHTHNRRSTHAPERLCIGPDCNVIGEHGTPPRLFMELFAVICIETSHYVTFVKCGVGHEAPWCFFDSMADRQGGQNGYNIPEMVACPDVSKWLSDEQSCRLLHENAPSDKYLPEYARRLLCDAYICMYQSPDVMMYR